MQTLQLLELSRELQRDRLEEAERQRTYKRLRKLQKEQAQPHTRRPRLGRRPIARQVHGWRIA